MASRLPEEVVEEILLRVPPDEPAHLVRATVVCKAWHSILSDDTFRRRYRRFHRTPLLGYIYNNISDSTVRFVPTTTVAAGSGACAPKLDDSSGRKTIKALDCRHGRVLIEVIEADGNRELIVRDTIAGSQKHLTLPTFLQNCFYDDYAGSVLCAMDDGCDHIDCHGGPFLVVLAGKLSNEELPSSADIRTWASVYKSETGVWSFPTTHNDIANQFINIDDMTPGLLIGDGLYYTTWAYNIVKYDLRKHELSVMPLPVRRQSIPIKVNDGGLGVAAMLHNHIYMWSWRVDGKGVGGWEKCKVVELDDMLLIRKGHLICVAEGTNTVFIGVEHTGVFTLDLTSRHVRKIREPTTYSYWSILPYMSFSSPKF